MLAVGEDDAAGVLPRPRRATTPVLTVVRRGLSAGDVVVLVLAAGAAWESRRAGPARRPPRHRGAQALRRRRRPAGRGRAPARPTSPWSRSRRPASTAAAVDHLRPTACAPVAVVPRARRSTQAARPPARIGVAAVVADDDLAALPDGVLAGEDAGADRPARGRSTDAPPPVAGAGGRVVAVWGPAGAPGAPRSPSGSPPSSRPARLPHGARRRRPLRRGRGPAARRPRRGLRPARRGPAAAERRAARERFGGARSARSAAASPSSPGCRGPTAGPRSGPASSSTCSRTARGHGHVVVDTGFSLEDDPVTERRRAPGPQPADPRRPRGGRRGGGRRHRRPGRAVPARPGPGRAARAHAAARRSASSSTGCGRPWAGPSATSPAWSRASRGWPGCTSCPTTGPRPTGRWSPAAPLVECGDVPLARGLAELVDALARCRRRRPRRDGGSGGEQQVEPAHGEADHRDQQRQLTGELVPRRAAAARPVVRRDHAEHVADDHRQPTLIAASSVGW